MVYSCLKGHCKDSGARLFSVVADNVEDGAKARIYSFFVLWLGTGENLFPRREVQPWEVSWGVDLGPWERVVAQRPPRALSMQHFTDLQYLSTVRKIKKNFKKNPCVAAIYADFSDLKITVVYLDTSFFPAKASALGRWDTSACQHECLLKFVLCV